MAKASILMVDDNPVNLVVLRALLGKEGYELIAADSGQAAVDLLQSNPGFDLVLLDVSMPGLDGICVCQKIKENPLTAHIPVVLVSAVRTDDESIAKGCNAGADGYLVKPIEDTAVRAWVRAALMLTTAYQETAREGAETACSAQQVRNALGALPSAVKSPLESLYAKADMLEQHLGPDSEQRGQLREIKADAESIARIVARASLKSGQTPPCKPAKQPIV